jgi:ketosteroid isomerase-like protein
VERTIVSDSEAAVTYVLTGTLQQRLGPFEPQGQKLELRGVHVFEVDGGLIRQTEDYWDTGTFGRQMRMPSS